MAVTADFLLKGYALALEQCGLLLRDAVLLYENKSYANAVVLAAFAREELGRSRILLSFLVGSSVDHPSPSTRSIRPVTIMSKSKRLEC